MAMKINRNHSKQRKNQRGVALLELMIAMVVLAFGLLGLLPLLVSSIGTNTNNRLDSTAVLLAQSIAEHIAAQPASAVGVLQLTDCAGNVWNVNTAGAPGPAGAGATLYTAGTAPSPQFVDSINFAQNVVPAGYQASFRNCDANNIRTTYDVRWNIQNVRAINGATITKLVTVAARPRFNNGQQMAIQFTLPVSLRTIVGQVP
jgi:type IV pilus modification protein PilV